MLHTKKDDGFWLPLCTFSEFICYDDGCHLRKFAQNVRRQPLSAITQKLATTEIVIDRMHFKGHKDSWCRETCDPSKFEELKKVRLNVVYPLAFRGKNKRDSLPGVADSPVIEAAQCKHYLFDTLTANHCFVL